MSSILSSLRIKKRYFTIILLITWLFTHIRHDSSFLGVNSVELRKDSNFFLWIFFLTTHQHVFLVQNAPSGSSIMWQVGQSSSWNQINSVLDVAHWWQLIREILREDIKELGNDRRYHRENGLRESFVTSRATRMISGHPSAASFLISLGLIKNHMTHVHSYHVAPNLTLVCCKLHQHKASLIHFNGYRVDPRNFVRSRMGNNFQI